MCDRIYLSQSLAPVAGDWSITCTLVVQFVAFRSRDAEKKRSCLLLHVCIERYTLHKTYYAWLTEIRGKEHKQEKTIYACKVSRKPPEILNMHRHTSFDRESVFSSILILILRVFWYFACKNWGL